MGNPKRGASSCEAISFLFLQELGYSDDRNEKDSKKGVYDKEMN